MKFEDLGLGPEVLAAIAKAGYHEATPIQQKAIPVALQGRDLLGCAQTGTGKTAAFVLPLLDILMGSRARMRMPRALIISPTRELAQQTMENFRIYASLTELEAALLVGGNDMRAQEQALTGHVDILIATPGRLLDMIERGKILMMGVKHLVIDEADRMLDMGFIPDVERICTMLPPLRHTLMFSATMPAEIRKLAERFLHNPREVAVAPPDSPADTVDQSLVIVEDGREKQRALRHLLGMQEVTSSMVFANRKRDVDSLHGSLVRRGIDAVRMQGDMSQHDRETALATFRNGDSRTMVCTDVAGRGIDIFGVSHVICYDVPVNAEDYVHRIGRTGRAGMRGCSYMLATPEDRDALDAIARLISRQLPVVELEGVRHADLACAGDRPRGSRRRDRRNWEKDDATARRRAAAKDKFQVKERGEVQVKERDEVQVKERDEVQVKEMEDAGAVPFGEGPFVPAFLLRPVAAGNTRRAQVRGDSDHADR